jgi:hypothetical protein
VKGSWQNSGESRQDFGGAHGRTVEDQGRTGEGSWQDCEGSRQDCGGLMAGPWRAHIRAAED